MKSISGRSVGRTVRALAGCAWVLVAGCGSQVWAAQFPDHAVRLVVPYPPGGGNDVIARIVAPTLARALGEQIVIDNRPGAGGTIGTNVVARAAPDGYTILIINTLPHTSAAGLYPKLPFDPVKDFASIGMIGSVPYMLAINKAVKANTVGEFIEEAKARPGALNYESAGVGSATHLAGEFFKSATKVNITHVPYKGGGPGMSDLLAGRVQATFENVAVLVPFVTQGTLRGLVITSKKRSSLFPNLPTMDESGYPGFEVAGKFGLVAPAGTPAAVIDKLDAALNKALADPQLIKLLTGQGVEPVPTTPAQYDALIKTESVKWLKVIRDANIQAE
jgi:tripartite-type tricarboxylate transporter receptor subunit TctC